jgi:hypothetical protein
MEPTAVSGLSCPSPERQRDKEAGTEKRERTKPGGRVAGCERKRGSCQTDLGFWFGAQRRGPKRPPESRPSGDDLEGGRSDY